MEKSGFFSGFLLCSVLSVVAFFWLGVGRPNYGAPTITLKDTLGERQTKAKDANVKLIGHNEEFNVPQVLRVTDTIYLAIGYAIANSMMITAPEGLIIVDTTESMEAAKKIFTEFRKIAPSAPVRAIIYTHNHADHVGGAQAFLQNTTDAQNGDSSPVEIWAHHTLTAHILHQNTVINVAHFRRGMRQFGPMLPAQINSGIGYRLDIGADRTRGFVAPNKFLVGDQLDVTIAGLNLKLLHIPGETDDQIAVWYPQERAIFCGDDLYKAFPNLYAIRGNSFRSLSAWVKSIDKMRALKPAHIVPSHTRPVSGETEIAQIFRDYRDAIQYVHDQTVRYINKDLHPDVIANLVKLPPSLVQSPYLQEFYGTVPWSVKGLFSGYLGWFSGDPAELNPYPPHEKADRLIKLGGGIDKVIQTAIGALDSGDSQWALELSSAVLLIDPVSAEAKRIKVAALNDLAMSQTSANGFNYYKTAAYETSGQLTIKPLPLMRQSLASGLPIRSLLEMLSVRFKGDICSHIDKRVTYNLTDINTLIGYHMRNGILDFNQPPDLLEGADIFVHTTSDVWRAIVGGTKYPMTAMVKREIVIGGEGVLAFKKLVECFDSEV